MTLEDIKKSLDENNSLTDEIKDNLYSLTYIFNHEYPAVSLDNLVNNLKNLKIVKSNKFLNKRVSKYDFRTNTMSFNTDKIEEGYDMMYIMMYELLNVISNNGQFTGFNFDDKYRALNAGYTEIIARNLVGNTGDVNFLENECITTNMISILVGDDNLEKAYFNNDPNLITTKLVENGIDEAIIDGMNYRYDNPGYAVKVDSKIAEKTLGRDEKTINSVRDFAEMSEEITARFILYPQELMEQKNIGVR